MICKSGSQYVRMVVDKDGWKLVGGNFPLKAMPDWPTATLQCQMLHLLPVFYLYESMAA